MTTWTDVSLEDFRAVVEQTTDPADYPLADAVERNVLIYGTKLLDQDRRAARAELAKALMDGPGIVVFKGAFEPAVVDRATAVFAAMIAEQKAAGVAGGDHFAKPGANDRVWGALDKFAVRDPGAFAAYYDNDLLALVCDAWLGSGYQVTSQVNVVNPGGRAQVAHRDYHLGFMSREQAERFPLHVHLLSPVLTLQGAVAHVDMPVETGPTLYLPHSQKYPAGYLAFHRPDFTEYFDANYVQLPLSKGDAAFFNPALFHGAGTNHTADVRRMANLLQISSAFGRAMETVDRVAMCLALYPALRRLADPGNVVAASAEGYAFPTNLDRDQPVGGLAPQTQAELVRQALAEGWPEDRFAAGLRAHHERRRAKEDPALSAGSRRRV
ncbi:phytanoyl-CoA dioxygenase family protein [Actinoplanes sp. NPDC049596]|uniref:phytanoyl-CoA dioxygenase family protein n=1 Tax=unclassified Actinoplanes TaxID=2626549 RepID=UPI00343937FA